MVISAFICLSLCVSLLLSLLPSLLGVLQCLQPCSPTSETSWMCLGLTCSTVRSKITHHSNIFPLCLASTQETVSFPLFILVHFLTFNCLSTAGRHGWRLGQSGGGGGAADSIPKRGASVRPRPTRWRPKSGASPGQSPPPGGLRQTQKGPGALRCADQGMTTLI